MKPSVPPHVLNALRQAEQFAEKPHIKTLRQKVLGWQFSPIGQQTIESFRKSASSPILQGWKEHHLRDIARSESSPSPKQKKRGRPSSEDDDLIAQMRVLCITRQLLPTKAARAVLQENGGRQHLIENGVHRLCGKYRKKFGAKARKTDKNSSY